MLLRYFFKKDMDMGYIENGFIVDVSNANKTSEIIYELSRILDLPDAQSKKVGLAESPASSK